MDSFGGADSESVRTAYLGGIQALVKLVSHDRFEARWDQPSVLADMDLSTLVGHVGLSISQVERFLDAEHEEQYRVDAVTYYARLADTDDPDSSFNVGIRTRATENAIVGYAGIVQDLSNASIRLAKRLLAEPADRTVSIAHRPGETMLLDEYLKTRCVELAIHLEDLELTVDVGARTPENVSTVACQVLFAAAQARHGSQAVLRSMARRERDDISALRVL